jgi:hypothetical protein
LGWFALAAVVVLVLWQFSLQLFNHPFHAGVEFGLSQHHDVWLVGVDCLINCLIRGSKASTVEGIN